MRFKKFIPFLIILISGIIYYLYAQNYHRDYSYINVISIHEDNYLHISVSDNKSGLNFAAEHGCDTQSYARSKWPLTDERTKAMLQVALASALSHSKVHVWTKGCTKQDPKDESQDTRPIFYRLQIVVD